MEVNAGMYKHFAAISHTTFTIVGVQPSLGFCNQIKGSYTESSMLNIDVGITIY